MLFRSMTTEEYFTIVGISTSGAAYYERFRVNPSLADNTAIAAGNIADVFAIEGNAAANIAIASNVISITLNAVAGCCAVIISKKNQGKYIHNEAVLGDGSSFSAPADTALPTYPVGAQNYLNGGDIFGQSESFNGGGDVPPTPSPTQSAISGVTVNGAALAQSGQANLNEGTNALVISILAGTDGASYGVACIAKAGAAIGGSVAAGSQTAVIGASVTLSEAAVTDGADKTIVLCRNNSIIAIWGTLKEPTTPAPSGDNFTVNGVQKTKGGSDRSAFGTQEAVVINVSEGSPLIGKKAGFGYANTAIDQDEITLVAGANSLTLTAEQELGHTAWYLLVGDTGSFETWFTFNFVED